MRVPIRKGFAKYQDDNGEFHLTPEAAERLKRELRNLESQVFAVAEEKNRAAAMGDRSENAEYQDAKARLSRLHSRITTIKDRLNRAKIIKKGTGADGLIDIGSTVTLMIAEKPETTKTYEIVGAFETNPAAGRISNKSPLGTALIGHGAGETVMMRTPVGATKYLIVDVI